MQIQLKKLEQNRYFTDSASGLSLSLKSKAVPPHAMEALGEEEVQLLFIHDLVTRWG
jgi:hypothetical protein